MRIRRTVKVSIVLFVLGSLWMLTVDESWIVEFCDDCGRERDLLQYRVCTIVVRETAVRTHETVISKMATDLGVPCPHRNSRLWHKHKWWGLLICAKPCINGLWRLSPAKWYTDATREYVRAYATRHPEIVAQYHERVLYNRDNVFVDSLIDEFRGASEEQDAE